MQGDCQSLRNRLGQLADAGSDEQRVVALLRELREGGDARHLAHLVDQLLAGEVKDERYIFFTATRVALFSSFQSVFASPAANTNGSFSSSSNVFAIAAMSFR